MIFLDIRFSPNYAAWADPTKEWRPYAQGWGPSPLSCVDPARSFSKDMEVECKGNCESQLKPRKNNQCRALMDPEGVYNTVGTH